MGEIHVVYLCAFLLPYNLNLIGVIGRPNQSNGQPNPNYRRTKSMENPIHTGSYEDISANSSFSLGHRSANLTRGMGVEDPLMETNMQEQKEITTSFSHLNEEINKFNNIDDGMDGSVDHYDDLENTFKNAAEELKLSLVNAVTNLMNVSNHPNLKTLNPPTNVNDKLTGNFSLNDNPVKFENLKVEQRPTELFSNSTLFERSGMFPQISPSTLPITYSHPSSVVLGQPEIPNSWMHTSPSVVKSTSGSSVDYSDAVNVLMESILQDENLLSILETYLSTQPVRDDILPQNSDISYPSFSGLNQPVPSPITKSDLVYVDGSNILQLQPPEANLMSIIDNQNINLQESSNDITIPSDILTNLLIRLRLPNFETLNDPIIRDNIAVPITRLSPALVTAISDFVNAITMAITDFIAALQAALADNPLLGVLLALGLLALLWHIFHKKKKKGYGHKHDHGHGGGGYHRSDWDPEFKSFEDYQQQLSGDVLNKIANFEQWLDTLDISKHK